MTDALTYAVLQNIIDGVHGNNYEKKQWSNYTTDLSDDPTKPLKISEVKDKVSELLTQTTIKRACCMADDSGCNDCYNVNVRIPTPKGYTYKDPDGADKIAKEMDYADIPIKIPKSMCKYVSKCNPNKSLCQKGYNPGPGTSSPECDKFYRVYCDNVVTDFMKQKNITQDDIDKWKFPYTDFMLYKPECACYAPKYKKFGTVTTDSPPCMFPECNPSSTAYMDTTSRTKFKPCHASICDKIFYEKTDFPTYGSMINYINAGCNNPHACEDENCVPEQCSFDGTSCEECGADYHHLADNTCGYSGIPCKDKNCDKCTDVGFTCTKCKDFFGVINTKCKSCNVSSCINCDNDVTKCKICKSGYGLINETTCKACKKSNCLECDGDVNTCKTCKPGYALKDGSCVTCSDSNCEKCSDPNKCDICVDGYYVDNNACSKCTLDNCITCSDANTCTRCKSGYSLDKASGKCIKDVIPPKKNNTIYYIGGSILSLCLSIIIVFIVVYLLFATKH